MIKDIVANLSLRDSPDVAVHFAVSVAAAFNAHLGGDCFRLRADHTGDDRHVRHSPDVIESQRVENERAAKAAVARLDEASRERGHCGGSAYA